MIIPENYEALTKDVSFIFINAKEYKDVTQSITITGKFYVKDVELFHKLKKSNYKKVTIRLLDQTVVLIKIV